MRKDRKGKATSNDCWGNNRMDLIILRSVTLTFILKISNDFDIRTREKKVYNLLFKMGP